MVRFEGVVNERKVGGWEDGKSPSLSVLTGGCVGGGIPLFRQKLHSLITFMNMTIPFRSD